MIPLSVFNAHLARVCNMSKCLQCLLDIDECAVGSDVCDTHAECSNTIGSYECSCTVGYTGNGFTCSKQADSLRSTVDLIIIFQAVKMERFFSMMGLHYPLTTPMELYWFVWTMSMGLCVMTGGTLWMLQLCVLSWDSQQMVITKLL